MLKKAILNDFCFIIYKWEGIVTKYDKLVYLYNIYIYIFP